MSLIVVVRVDVVVTVIVFLVVDAKGGLVVIVIGGRGRVTMSSTQESTGPSAMLVVSV